MKPSKLPLSPSHFDLVHHFRRVFPCWPLPSFIRRTDIPFMFLALFARGSLARKCCSLEIKSLCFLHEFSSHFIFLCCFFGSLRSFFCEQNVKRHQRKNVTIENNAKMNKKKLEQAYEDLKKKDGQTLKNNKMKMKTKN